MDTTVAGQRHVTSRSTPRVRTVVVGGGQAGLAVGHHLGRRDHDFVILDAHARVGDSWRSHWDSLRLYSPASRNGLPGMPFPAPGHTFPTKDEVADYLEAYARRFELPVRTGTRVQRLSAHGAGYLVECEDVRFEADNVVVATGTFGRTPYVPGFAAELEPGIRQLHSSEYHHPDQLAPGPVLVVGASHSGGDIAYEVASTHETVLCGRDTGQIPPRLEGRAMRVLFPVLWFVWGHVLSVRTPAGRKGRRHARQHGAPLLRVKRQDLAAVGVERVTERVIGTEGGLPVLGDGRVLDVASVVWCTGFRQDFSWVDLPVVGDDGWPREERGVVPTCPGLYFAGLCFQSSFRSMLIGGAGADAEYVVRHLLRHRPLHRTAPASAVA